jgi:excisionase family DNA binding protein
MSAQQTYSAEKLAGLLGLSSRTILEWINAGCPAEKVGRAYALSAADVHEWRVKRERERTITEMGMVDESQARRRKMAAEAIKAEIEAARMAGDALGIAEWQAAHAALIGTARGKFLGLGVRLAPELAITNDPTECQDLIDSAVRDILAELSNFELSDDIGSGAKPAFDGPEGVQALGAAAGSDRKRVGRHRTKA